MRSFSGIRGAALGWPEVKTGVSSELHGEFPSRHTNKKTNSLGRLYKGRVPFGGRRQESLVQFERRRELRVVGLPMGYANRRLTPRMLDDSYVNVRSR